VGQPRRRRSSRSRKIDTAPAPFPALTNPTTTMPAYNNSNRRRAPAKKDVAPPKPEPKPDIDPKTGKPDWSRYNATVVGAGWDPRAPLHPAELPGLAAARERGLAAQAAWLATRKTYTYEDPDDGWVRVRSRGRRSRIRDTEDD
jgi:hypothetical protein